METAVRSAGYSYTLFTGEMKDLKPFKEGKVQVLIASRPISVGVDELQWGCNRLIFNTPPWTNAQYEQIIGRLDRKGQSKDVDVFIIKASVGGDPYDERIKWTKIRNKRTLTDTIIDGILPEKDSIAKSALILKAVDAAHNWTERLEEGEHSIVTRSDLNILLTPAVNQKVLLINEDRETVEHNLEINLSEFSRLNNLFNNSKSDTLQKRIQQDPQLLVEYHKYFEEHKRQWDFDPLEVIASKIRKLKIPARIIMKYVIGDFGCGKAKLAELLKENRMYSFDFDKILNDRIIPCDMKSVPLPSGRLDIAVFCQSLMEENWREYILEARRCLTKNGLLYIVETTRSLTARLCGLREILKEQGFEINSDEQTGTFTFIEARRL